MPGLLKRISAMATQGLGQMVTERDNATLDIKRVAALGSIAAALGLKVYDVVWRRQPLDFTGLCTGLAALLGALGAILAVNRNTEHGE